MKIIGFFEIDEGIPLSSDCLAESFKIRVNNFEGTIKTPELTTNLDKKKEILITPLTSPNNEFIMGFKDLDWGYIKSPQNGNSLVKCLMIEFKNLNEYIEEGIDSELLIEMPKWIERFRENFFAFDYNVDTPEINVKYGHSYNLFYQDKLKNTPKSIGNKGVTISMSKGATIKKEDFQCIIDMTSFNKKISLELQLLRESHIELINENFRKSILDCASSLEVALTKTIKRELKIKSDLLEGILKMNNSIFKKRKLIDYTDIKLPNHNFKKDVEDLRNRAIHAGKTPNRDETALAYKIVKETISTLNLEKFE